MTSPIRRRHKPWKKPSVATTSDNLPHDRIQSQPLRIVRVFVFCQATEDRLASRAILACWTFLPVRSFSLILRLLGVVWMDEHDFDRFGFRDIRIDVRINFAPGVILWPAPGGKFQGQPGALECQALRVGFGDHLLGSVGAPNGSRLWPDRPCRTLTPSSPSRQERRCAYGSR